MSDAPPQGMLGAESPRSMLLDLALAAAAAYIAWALAAETAGPGLGWREPVILAIAVLHGASIVVRRRATRVMFGVLIGTATVYAAFGFPVVRLGPAMLVALYTAGSRLPRRTALWMLALAEVALVALTVGGQSYPGADSVVLFAALLAGAWFLGDVVRRWQTLAEEYARRTVELEQARAELARHAVTAERVRIARELHDIVAHSLSVVAMHAGAGRLAVGTDPASERTALEVIERTTRNALAEMRRLVTVLREGGSQPADLDPAPGLGRIHDLVAGMAAAGGAVEVHCEGDLDSLPPGPSLAGYRVVQEALTNVVRHVGRAHVRVSVDAGAGMLVVVVENDPPAHPPQEGPPPAGGVSDAGGLGTLGMRERVELYRGSLSSGPTPSGGWRVEARLPYQEATT